MKRWLVVVLIVTLAVLAGCTKPEEENKEPVEEPQEVSEFSILVEDDKVSLMDWDTEVNLEEIFGKPVEEKTEILGPNSDTFNGSYMKEIIYDGIKFTMFSPKDNGKTFFVLSMDIMDSKITTKRGIKIGDSLEKLNEVYPEIQPVLDGREDKDNRSYKIEEGAYNYIIFEVKEGIISHIKIYHEFA